MTLSRLHDSAGFKSYLAYPKINILSEIVINTSITPVELTIPWTNSEEYAQVKCFISENNIRLIYFTDQPYRSFQYILLRLRGVKHIVIHDHTPGDRPPVKGVKGFIKATINKIPWITADKILCVSALMRQRNILNARIPPRKCVVVQNGIQPVICTPEKYDSLRKSLELQPQSTVVVTTGRAHPYKRFDFIIQCAKKLRDTAPDLDVVFLLVGGGPAMPELKKMVSDNGLEKSVRLLGFRNDTRDLLCISDIALHAALGEGFSLSILEYMSAGLPVLVPDIPSVSQAITQGKTGFIYPKDDCHTVALLLKDLDIDFKLRTRLGNNAKSNVDSRYTLSACTNQFIELFNKIHE